MTARRRSTQAIAARWGCWPCSAPAPTSPAGGASEGATSDAAAPAEVEATNDWALAYTGGTEGPADETLDPITVGYINQEGGVPSFPEATAGIEAAVEYVNTELGGVQGHPVELASCQVQAEEDGQRCATEMVNDDDVPFVMTGTMVVGDGSIYSTLGGQKPVIIGFPGVAEDFIAQDAYAFTPGAVGVVTGMSTFVGEHLDGVESVAVVHSDNAAGRAGAESILVPGLAEQGIDDVTLVPVFGHRHRTRPGDGDPGGGRRQRRPVHPAGVGAGLHRHLRRPPVAGRRSQRPDHRPLLRHADDEPHGQPRPRLRGPRRLVLRRLLGYSYFLPDEESGMNTYLAEIAEYGPEGVEYTGFAGPLFANLLTMVRLMNDIGPDAVSPETVREGASGFEGPMMMVAGPMDCGFSPIYVSLCGHQMGVQQYADGEWSSIANALNGEAIETALTAP